MNQCCEIFQVSRPWLEVYDIIHHWRSYGFINLFPIWTFYQYLHSLRAMNCYRISHPAVNENNQIYRIPKC